MGEADSGITLRLDGFEGPLDLLLHLIRKEEIDVWNIPIARITEQYLRYLDLMKDLNINVAGEWIAMAATLIFIKSRMLLPPDPSEETAAEDPEDPRNELVYQLLEHQKFKNAAQMLHTREEVEAAVWSNPPKDIQEESKHVVSLTLFDLVQAFAEIVRQYDAEQAMEVAREEMSVEDKILQIRQILLVRDDILFSSLFVHSASRQHLIVTFLALLELVRLREALVYQEQAFEEIHVRKRGADLVVQ